MKIINFFKPNNWKIRTLLVVVFTIQLALVSVIGLEKVGIPILLLRQLFAFVYLTFIPGILIIRILKMHKLTNVEVVLYSSGISIASLLFIGFFMNMIYPIFGIFRPISLNYLLITFSIFILFLSILSYIRDRDFYREELIDLKEIFSSWSLFLCLMPLLAIVGTHLVNFYNNNLVLMFLIAMLAIIPILIAYNKIPEKYYPLAIFSVAISLLFHSSLISNYIWGWDIHVEYHYAELVLNNAFWNPQFDNFTNSVLSIVMLGPLFSIISNIDLTWTFKIIYPFLFSLFPVGLYILFQRQTEDDQISFLACFFFMAIFIFFVEMPSLARQQIAKFFLILLILLFFSKENKPILLIIFGMAMIVSHYSLAYLYMFILLGVGIFLIIITNTNLRNFIGRFNYLKTKLCKNISLELNKKLTLNFVLFFVVFSITWYVYVSGYLTFETIVRLISRILGTMFTDFLNPDKAQGMQILITHIDSPMRRIAKYLYIITQFLIVVGFIGLIFSKYKSKFDIEFIIFSFFNLLICIGAIVLPYFAIAWNTSRLYYLSLIFLAPFCILGGITVFGFFSNLIKPLRNKGHENSLKIISIFLAIFLLFNTGFVIEFTEESPSSFAFSKNDHALYFQRDSDVASAQWLENFNASTQKYAMYFSKLSLISYGNLSRSNIVRELYNWTDVRTIRLNSYIYVRSGENANIPQPMNNSYAFGQGFLNSINKIYDSGSKIYYKT